MAKDADYDKLYAQYQILLTQNADLQEQLSVKTTLWEQYAQKCAITDDHARKLCEMILAKDRSEMTLGNTKTWHSYTTDELIQRAKNSYTKYIKSRTDLMNQIMDIAESRARRIEDLEDQIRNLIEFGPKASTTTLEQLQADQDTRKKEAQARSNMTQSLRDSEASGNAIIIVEDDSVDLTAEEVQSLTQLASQAEQVKLTPSPVTTIRSKKKEASLQDVNDTVQMYHYTDLKSTIDALTESQWYLLEVIAKQGISLMSKLIEIALSEKTDMFKASSTVRSHVSQLCARSVVELEKVTLPVHGAALIIKLTHIGMRICEHEFGKKPVTPEWAIVCQEHDNLEHGYGILDCQELLESLNMFESVSSYNRKKPYNVKIDGVVHQYIPDLLCERLSKKGNKVPVFIEYERGTHTQPDFSMKCDKMCKVTSVLYFIMPNKATLAKVKKQLETWAQLRGAANLKAITARLTTAPYLKSCNASRQKTIEDLNSAGKATEIAKLPPLDPWLLEYKYGEGLEPTKDLSGSDK